MRPFTAVIRQRRDSQKLDMSENTTGDLFHRSVLYFATLLKNCERILQKIHIHSSWEAFSASYEFTGTDR